MGKRGQSSMEFLMTYGWAVLAIIAAVGALAYYNVFSPAKYFPDECELFSQVECKAWKVSSSQIEIVVRNEFGQVLSPFNITVISDEGCNGAFLGAASGLGDGEEEKMILACTTAITGERYSATLNVSYTGSSGSYHVAYGRIKSQVE
ncbi:MAG TPA: hypothetical protein VJJ75_03115 [Candidatus Nanoarchaeia archaeon]|nr:hypothetical protein [Candidatus Nanoarchaeia archaeon]